MTIDDIDSAVGALRAAAVSVEGALPADDVASIWELIDAGEAGVAFEHLCTQLYEYDVALDAVTGRQLAAVGRYLRFDPELWEQLDVTEQ